MDGRSMRRWNASGSVLMVLVAALTVAIGASPAEAGRKSKVAPDPAIIVSELIAKLDDRMADLDAGAGKLMVDVEKRMDRAVTRIGLREVLKTDQQAARSMARALKSFDRTTTRDESKVLKALSKLTTNPEHALTVRMAVAEAMAHAQTVHNDLRSGVAEHVNDAIDQIQGILNEDIVNQVPKS